MSTIYIGTADLAHNKIRTLQKPEYRKRYESAYQIDFKRYGGELTLEKTNKKIKSLLDGRNKILKRRERIKTSLKPDKETLLMINHFLLSPEDVDQELIINRARELCNRRRS